MKEIMGRQLVSKTMELNACERFVAKLPTKQFINMKRNLRKMFKKAGNVKNFLANVVPNPFRIHN